MAKKNDQEFVKHITPRSENFSQWYTDVVLQADLMDYTPVRGCMAIKPYGYGIWELIQKELDARFKATGHENVSMPMLIPESLLLKEADHVEGFAPEVAWVTQGGTEPLQERLAVRPTSETIFCTMYSKWVQSWRDLPLKYNQWCSVMRWEKTTRPFLRTAEFLWQEGHTVHATAEEAQEETMQMLHVYHEFCENVLAVPVYSGQKSDKEKFAGARATYSVEAMMQDGKALQSGTSHNFGTNFAEPFEITYLSKDGKLEYCHETSWGVSTRLIGAIIMTHGDERGLKLPPKVAPIQAVILPIAAHKGGVMEKCQEIRDQLAAAGIRVRLDDRDNVSAGWKFNEWELKGVPVRLEVGPRDLEAGQVLCVRRDTFEKKPLPLDGLAGAVKATLEDVHRNMFEIARAFRDEHTKVVHNMDELTAQVDGGYAKAMWCGDQACEDRIKELTGATSRNMPFNQTPVGDTCVCCGKKADKVMYFAKAY
ncbi:MAG TPA: proline--tRNA ligase [Candidatus Onthenecus intestinigallinarum]|uniref:Proline--tRNA ligase n=1 Tax=Candidatus Onthenecus intestinigallinarum TaxID=2840875 RepID=A0A9D0Z7I4_9FIRM|nr:proline--tRNA ligase [Candidatus Onthenecus intestinigallinarum]